MSHARPSDEARKGLLSAVCPAFLADDKAIRLGFERALGTLDRKAGQLLSNDALTRRGEALIRRSEVLANAVNLEQEAAAKQAEAEERLRAEKQAAARGRGRPAVTGCMCDGHCPRRYRGSTTVEADGCIC